MLTKKRLRMVGLLASGGLVGAIAGLPAVSTAATSANTCANFNGSNYGLITATIGDNYNARATVDHYSNSGCTSGVTSPAHSLRAKNAVYWNSGSGDNLCASSSYTDNPSASNSWVQNFSFAGCGTGKSYRDFGTLGELIGGNWYTQSISSGYKTF